MARQWIGSLVSRCTDPFRRDGSSWLFVALLFVATPLGLLAAYQQWGGLVLGDAKYRITAESLEVSPPQPTWIYGNVKAEVIRDGSLEERSALESSLTPQMIDAFELHPWVESVVSLRKEYPNSIRVQLSYRRPVAMVEVFDEKRWISPVDRFGYVLPTDGFQHNLDSPDHYLRIYVGQQLAPAVAGTLWPDVRIRDASALAGVLAAAREPLGLYRIVALPAAEEFRAPQFALATRQRAVVIWGSGPGEEEKGESNASDKLAALQAFVREHGALDTLPSNRLLDLRYESAILIEPQTASRPAATRR